MFIQSLNKLALRCIFIFKIGLNRFIWWSLTGYMVYFMGGRGKYLGLQVVVNTIFSYLILLYFLWFLFFSYLFWMIFAQNPDNLRHMIPLVFLANIIIVLSFKNITFFIPLFLILNLYFHTKYDAKISPIEQVLEKIKNDKNSDKVVITNRGIEILR